MAWYIDSVSLTKPPLDMSHIASLGNLLAGWRWINVIMADDGSKHHFALYSPAYGWRAYRLDNQYYRFEEVEKVLPASKDTIWVNASDATTGYLMCLRIEPSGRAKIVGCTSRGGYLLYADKSMCLVKKTLKQARYLRLYKDGTLKNKGNINFSLDWAHALPDNTMLAGDSSGLLMLSSSGKIIHSEDRIQLYHHPPFIVHVDQDRLSYTDDPRKGWKATTILETHKNHTGADELKYIPFFAVLNGICYTAIEYYDSFGPCVALYRFSEKSPHSVEYAGKLSAYIENENGFAVYGQMICITSTNPISGSHVPENHGFLVWEPISNTFHTDIPRTTNIQKISIGRNSAIHIPDIWGQNTRQR